MRLFNNLDALSCHHRGDYTHYVQSSFGFSAEIDEMLTKAAIESSLVLKEKGL